MTEPTPIRRLLAEASERGVFVAGFVEDPISLALALPRDPTAADHAIAAELIARSEEAIDAIVGDAAAALLTELPDALA